MPNGIHPELAPDGSLGALCLALDEQTRALSGDDPALLEAANMAVADALGRLRGISRAALSQFASPAALRAVSARLNVQRQLIQRGSALQDKALEALGLVTAATGASGLVHAPAANSAFSTRPAERAAITSRNHLIA